MELKHIKIIFLLLSILLVAFLVNISLGSVPITISETFNILFGGKNNSTAYTIIKQLRLPKAIAAIMVGSGLSVSGLLMQSFFRNPLAGPYVLGLSSGSSLGIALLTMGAGYLGFLSSIIEYNWGNILVACLGSTIVFLSILWISLKIKDSNSLLIFGLMIGSFSSAIITVLSYFSTSQNLQRYIFWGLGSLSNLEWEEIYLLAVIWFFSLLLALLTTKFMNSWRLGDLTTKSLGINIFKHKIYLIIATSLLTGIITALCGPIAFVGLIVPYLAKLFFSETHRTPLFFYCMLIGGIFMLICDTIAQVPGYNFVLPINAITSLIGAPVIITLLAKKRKLFY